MTSHELASVHVTSLQKGISKLPNGHKVCIKNIRILISFIFLDFFLTEKKNQISCQDKIFENTIKGWDLLITLRKNTDEKTAMTLIETLKKVCHAI